MLQPISFPALLLLLLPNVVALEKPSSKLNGQKEVSLDLQNVSLPFPFCQVQILKARGPKEHVLQEELEEELVKQGTGLEKLNQVEGVAAVVNFR